MFSFKSRIIGACVLAAISTGALAADAPAFKSDKEKLSYAIGASIGRNFVKEGTDVDVDILMSSLKAALAGQKMQLSDKEVRVVMSQYENDLRKKMAISRQKAANENRQKGEAFLAEFRKQPGVQSTPGGVLYQVLAAGSGTRKPIETEAVEVNYRGTLIDGTEFDATEAGHPATLKVMALITGWKQALTMMPVGAKWHIVIPAELAYGERGVGADIGPNQTLVFDLELVSIKDK